MKEHIESFLLLPTKPYNVDRFVFFENIQALEALLCVQIPLKYSCALDVLVQVLMSRVKNCRF